MSISERERTYIEVCSYSFIATIQYIIKDRTERFDDYFPCRKDNNDCKLKHVMNWLGLFVDMHNREIMEKNVK